ncbi:MULTISPECIES: protein YgfX [Microbulbifer]|uniref:protein YgfX n=1 Tax=Microbulbifer TaxID=48073 RepID=UPI0015964746|nr:MULTISPECIES: protein YgfX [Microbulbifer]
MTTPGSRNNTGSVEPLVVGRSARLRCPVSPSRLLFLLLLLISLQALTVLWFAGFAVTLLAPAVLLVIALGLREARRLTGYRGEISTMDRRWFWRATGGEPEEITLSGELVLWPWLIVINGRDQGGQHRRLVLARDSVTAEDWRRLQVALRYSR